MVAPRPKVCIVHDWLTNPGGAERVVLALSEAYPDAPIYTSVYEPSQLPAFANKDVRTTGLQKLPRPLRRLHKLFPTLRVRAFAKLDLSEFDLIISSASAEAKQVRKTRPGQRHICYCHTPIRYYWSHYHDYRQHPGFGVLNPLVRLIMPLMVRRQRQLDFAAAQKVDQFIANSREVQKRIKKYYHRDSVVINPPADIERFTNFTKYPRRGWLAVGRQVAYKRFDLAIAAANQLGEKLTVFGRGPEHEKLAALASPNVHLVTNADDAAIARALQSAKYFLFPTEEDFGIVQVEALAAGTPVIAFGQGGSLDIVKAGQTGLLFRPQTVAALVQAIKRAEQIKFSPTKLHATASKFSRPNFIKKIKALVNHTCQT